MRTPAILLVIVAGGIMGCVHEEISLFAPRQGDGWSAQPVSITARFSEDASLDPDTLTPVGDAGYYFYILTRSGEWDYKSTRSYVLSHARQPWGHSWLILESPESRLECGLNGNFGRDQAKYGDGVSQRFRNGDPNPIAYLWVTMRDGEIEHGNGGRVPTFAWRMPITSRQHRRIHDLVLNWKYQEIGVVTNNCVDLVTDAAELAGIRLIHRVRLTFPQGIEIMGKKLHMWSDPRYRVLEYSTPDVLEVDLRQLARFGIGRDVTEWYRHSEMAAPPPGTGAGVARGNRPRAEDGI